MEKDKHAYMMIFYIIIIRLCNQIFHHHIIVKISGSFYTELKGIEQIMHVLIRKVSNIKK